MPILSISRDWGIDPQIVRILTSDTLNTIVTTGYWTTQLQVLNDLQHGNFSWRDSDVVLIAYNGGKGYFTFDLATLSFLPVQEITSQILLSSAQIMGMFAAPVNIIPSPGAGKLVIVGQNTYTYLFGGIQYTLGGAIGLEYGAVAAKAGPAASTTLAGATFDGYAASNTFELTPDNTDVLANIIGLGVFLSNDTAAFATGNGTLQVNINYKIVKAT